MPKISEDTLAYLATLAALVCLVILAMLIGAFFPPVLSKVEAFGLGTVTGGLIGLMRSPRRQPQDALPLMSYDTIEASPITMDTARSSTSADPATK